jgi:pimeloyl-ACP methyl ester carboxylesterase
VMRITTGSTRTRNLAGRESGLRRPPDAVHPRRHFMRTAAVALCVPGLAAATISPALTRAPTSSVMATLAVAGGVNGTVGDAGRGTVPRFESARCPSLNGRAFKQVFPYLARARCGYLVVPEDRRWPNGAMIRLAAAILPARSRSPVNDPIVYVSGGPGSPTFFDAQPLVSAGLNRDHELIFMVERGTLFSEPALACSVIDRFRVRRLALRYDAASTGRAQVAATRSCRRQLAARGIDLGAYNTGEVAADIADLRRALGYRSYDLYGFSYGTKVALEVMRNYPAGIRSVVLDSTVAPGLIRPSAFWSQAHAGFHNLFAACAAQRACEASYPGLEAAFTRLVRHLEAHPISTIVPDPQTGKPTTVVLDGGALVNWLVSMAGAPRAEVIRIPQWIEQLAKGDARSIAASLAAAVPSAGLENLVGYGIKYSVYCSEYTPFDSESDVLIAGRQAFPGYPRSVLAQAPQAPFIFDDCRAWNVRPLPDARQPTLSTIPTLILSGTFDSVTALDWARSVARTLPNSQVVQIPGAGHFVLPFSACAQSVTQSFLERPRSPRMGCVSRQRPPEFVTGQG